MPTDPPPDIDAGVAGPSEARLARLEARVRDLEDRAAIRDLIAAYGPAADSGDCAAAAVAWAADGSYDIDGFGIVEGPAGIAAILEGAHHQQLIAGGAAHVLSPLAITLSGDTATAVGYSCVFRHTGDGFEAHRVAANRWTLVRADGQWRIARRVNRLLNGAEAARALLRP